MMTASTVMIAQFFMSIALWCGTQGFDSSGYHTAIQVQACRDRLIACHKEQGLLNDFRKLDECYWKERLAP